MLLPRKNKKRSRDGTYHRICVYSLNQCLSALSRIQKDERADMEEQDASNVHNLTKIREHRAVQRLQKFFKKQVARSMQHVSYDRGVGSLNDGYDVLQWESIQATFLTQMREATTAGKLWQTVRDRAYFAISNACDHRIRERPNHTKQRVARKLPKAILEKAQTSNHFH